MRIHFLFVSLAGFSWFDLPFGLCIRCVLVAVTMEIDCDHGNKEELLIWAYSSRVRVHREEEACLGSQNGKPRDYVFTRKAEAERAVWKWGETMNAQSRPSVIFPNSRYQVVT